jgi:hypothetical protein
MTMKYSTFWDVTPCNLKEIYYYCEEHAAFTVKEDELGNNKFLPC